MVSIESQEEAVRWALRHSSIDKLMTAETIVKNLKDIGMKISTRTVSAIARETRKALGDDSRDATAHRPPILALKQPLVRGDGPSAHPEDESDYEGKTRVRRKGGFFIPTTTREIDQWLTEFHKTSMDMLAQEKPVRRYRRELNRRERQLPKTEGVQLGLELRSEITS